MFSPEEVSLFGHLARLSHTVSSEQANCLHLISSAVENNPFLGLFKGEHTANGSPDPRVDHGDQWLVVFLQSHTRPKFSSSPLLCLWYLLVSVSLPLLWPCNSCDENRYCFTPPLFYNGSWRKQKQRTVSYPQVLPGMCQQASTCTTWIQWLHPAHRCTYCCYPPIISDYV